MSSSFITDSHGWQIFEPEATVANTTRLMNWVESVFQCASYLPPVGITSVLTKVVSNENHFELENLGALFTSGRPPKLRNRDVDENEKERKGRVEMETRSRLTVSGCHGNSAVVRKTENGDQ